MHLTATEQEREVLYQLKTTKQIYELNFARHYYQNNAQRAALMKRNFMRYYQQTAEEDPTPKVIFKMGANHAGRGLTNTNVYDIGNLATELAVTNDLESLHILVMGVEGEMRIGNPFAPVPTAPFDNTEDFPDEIQQLLELETSQHLVVDLEPLRTKAKQYSHAFQQLMFRYDVAIYVRNAQPLQGL